MLTAPVLNGATLRRPNRYTPALVPVREDVVLAGGGLRRYVRGKRMTAELEWENLPGEAVAVIEAAAGEGILLFVDPSGVSRWVYVDDGPDAVPVPGTDPPRYEVSLTLASRDVTR